MLDQLRASAAERGIALRALHAAAEQLPLEPACLDLVVVADALHFLDTELTARQIARVLAPRGALALVTCKFADTPFMRGVVRLIEEAVPRRPRALTQSIVHLSALSGVPLTNERRFHDETPVDHATLERILRSISFIGPAMNPARFAAFRAARPCPARGAGLGTDLRAPLRSSARRGGPRLDRPISCCQSSGSTVSLNLDIRITVRIPGNSSASRAR